MSEYTSEHGEFRLDAEGRSPRCTVATWEGDSLKIQQLLQDYEEYNDWCLEFEVPLSLSREAGIPLLRLLRIGPV